MQRRPARAVYRIELRLPQHQVLHHRVAPGPGRHVQQSGAVGVLAACVGTVHEGPTERRQVGTGGEVEAAAVPRLHLLDVQGLSEG